MSLVDAPIACFPTKPWLCNTGSATSSFTFDTSTDRLVTVFQIQKTGTIDNIHYRINSVTSPSMTHRISIQTVDAATGLPTGTLYGSSSAVTVAASGYSANTNYTANVACTGATKGDVVAVVFDLSLFTSGSFTQLFRIGPLTGEALTNNRSMAFPYAISNTAGSDVKTTFVQTGFALEYSGGVFHPVTQNYTNFVGTVSSASVTNSGTTRRGNKYTIPTPRRAVGIWATLALTGGITLTLRDSGGTLLATCTPDKDILGSSSVTDAFFLFDSGATVTLTKGATYYIGVEGQDATGGTVYYMTGPSNASLGGMPGGINCFGFTYAGSYSDANTTLYWMGLITDQEDDGTGGGGGAMVIGG